MSSRRSTCSVGSVDADTFRDRVVLVGVTEPTIGDQHLVPTDRSGSTSGVVVLANATNTILSNWLPRSTVDGDAARPDRRRGAVVTALFASVRLRTGVARRPRRGRAVVLVRRRGGSTPTERCGTSCGPCSPSCWRLPPGPCGSTSSSPDTDAGHGACSRPMSRPTWCAELEDPSRLAAAVSGVRCDVTVVFCDIRDFTALSGTLPPARVRDCSTPTTSTSVAIIHRHRGTVMQFVGDEVFAVFGAPSPARRLGRGFRCALALQDEVASARRPADGRWSAADPLRHRGPPRTGRGRPRRDGGSASVRRRR